MRNARITYLIIIVALMTTTCRKSEVQKLAEAAALGELSYKEYKTADYDCAKAALLYFIKFNKKLIASPTTERQTYTADIMISYVRLAKLEERHGSSEKGAYMAQAASYCQKVNFKKPDCSAETLRKAVDLLDQVPVK